MAFIVRGRIDTDAVHPRLEIRDLRDSKDPKISKEWTLFVIALLGIQYPDTQLPFVDNSSFRVNSLIPPGGDFFSIGAVHGLPYERWPGDPASDQIATAVSSQGTSNLAEVKPTSFMEASHNHKNGADDDPVRPGDENFRFGGYCNHRSILFPPWHRPYVMAIEESIGRVATALAEEFGKPLPEKEENEWKDAAAALRFPFWDWTLEPEADQSYFPSLFTDHNVEIIGPGGKSATVQNPLHSFRLERYTNTERCRQFADVKVEVPNLHPNQPPVYQMGYYRSWHRTVRWPQNSIAAAEQPGGVENQMKQWVKELRHKLWHMFSLPRPSKVGQEYWPHFWDEFSNASKFKSDAPPEHVVKKFGSDQDHESKEITPTMSLESPHDWIHLILGGMGHMGQNEYAAFDPIFFLHHSNCDRLYALWEWVYPEYRPQYGWHQTKTGDKKHFLQPGGTATKLPASRLDQWSDMLPWRKNLGSYWTTDDISWENRSDKKWNFYTYPIVAGVDVDVAAATEDERMAARARLQEHFDPTIKKVRDKPKYGFPIFQPASSLLGQINTEGLKMLDRYRHFVITVTLKEHLYNESYYLELRLPLSNNPQVLWYGHAAVLTRSVDTPCEGCQRRMAAGTEVKDMIHIPTSQVADILTGLGEKAQTDAGAAVGLKGLIRGRLIGRGGTVYAHTVPLETKLPKEDALAANLVPKLRFMMAYAGTESGLEQENAPVELTQWQDFGEVFEGTRWKMGTEQSMEVDY